MIRQGLVGMALALSAQAAVAGTVAVDGVSVALPVDVSEAKREREFELKDAFIGRGNETRLYDIPREGPHRVLLSGTVRSLHLKSAPSLPQGDPVKNRDAQLASRRAKDATADLEALTVAGSPALLQLSTIKGDEGDTAFAELNVYRPTGAIFIVLAYPDQAMTRDAVRAAMRAATVDPARFDALQAETAAVIDASSSGARVNTQIGQFDFQDGTRPVFLKAKVEASPEAGLRTSMLYRVDRTTFWTGQRAVASFTCLPFVAAGSGKETVEDTLRKGEGVSDFKALPVEMVDKVPVKRFEFDQAVKGMKLPTTVWVVEGRDNTMMVNMSGYTTNTFRNQLGKSVVAASGRCASIPGSTLDLAAAQQ